MQLKVPPGKYVLAVSGGVDSMSLLDMLAKNRTVELIVAHFNHGMRGDARYDEKLVKAAAEKYGLVYVVGYGNLGAGASEQKARAARYNFLESVKENYQAKAIITAHHQDDMIETAFINLLRGSGRRGLSAISESDIVRPLLEMNKANINQYAKDQKITWQEDASNQDLKYLRNYLRKIILPKLTKEERLDIISNIEKVAKTNAKLNKQIATLSHNIMNNDSVDRAKFTLLPQEIATELVIEWLRSYGIRQFDKKMVERLTMSIKTAQPNSRQPVSQSLWLKIDQKNAHFATTERNA